MTYELPVERGKIREFARAVHARHPAHAGADAIIPPTYLTMARLAWEPRAEDPTASAEIDMRRVLHGEEEYVFHGPPPTAGRTLQVSSRLERTWQKPGKRGGMMRFLLVVAEFRDEAGRLVAEQRSTLVETAKAPPAPGAGS